jgi:hypothetical protein
VGNVIIDAFPFFDELDLLEIRLNELHEVVDLFILTESTHTFTGIEKPLYFDEHRKRFDGFTIYHTVYVPGEVCEPLIYEKRQKQYNLDCAFDRLAPGDVLITGDVDEIPKADVVKRALDDSWQSAGLMMTLYYYYMNYRSTVEKKRRDSRLLRYSSPFEYNLKQDDPVDITYPDAGWHFSFLGDVAAKLKAWGHALEYDRPPFNTPEHIERCKEQGLDLFMRQGRRKLSFERVDDLSYLPQYVLDNLDKFGKYIK